MKQFCEIIMNLGHGIWDTSACAFKGGFCAYAINYQSLMSLLIHTNVREVPLVQACPGKSGVG